MLDIRKKKKVIFSEGAKALTQAGQRGSGCHIPGDTQGETGPGSEQPG